MPRTADQHSAERILDVVEHLFYREGVHAVGMQRVIDDCHCGKKLLYRDFPSKDDLVLAYLARMRERWQTTLLTELDAHPDDWRAQLVAVVRAAGRELGTPEHRGCAFLNARAEYPDADHPVHQACEAHTADLRALLRRLARKAGAQQPHRLAERLLLVVNGVRASGPGADKKVVRCAVDLAREFVNDACGGAASV